VLLLLLICSLTDRFISKQIQETTRRKESVGGRVSEESEKNICAAGQHGVAPVSEEET
jgi:hypothetical protein